MIVVVALGGHALLRRGYPMTAEVQWTNVRTAAVALAPVAAAHQLVLVHGNGPQVGMAALADAGRDGEGDSSYVRLLETEGMVGYLLERALADLLPPDVPLATVLAMTEVDPHDPAFDHPTTFVGPRYGDATAARLRVERGWSFKRDGGQLRRVVASPVPTRILERRPIQWLLEHGTVVICACGGGVPTAWLPGRTSVLRGVEAVVDKDLASELLAREVGADMLVLATDVDGVYEGWGTPDQRRVDTLTPHEIRSRWFAASMGRKVEAAARFVEATRRPAAIGSLTDLAEILAGRAGTLVVAER
jgi:carbamate kinase